VTVEEAIKELVSGARFMYVKEYTGWRCIQIQLRGVLF